MGELTEREEAFFRSEASDGPAVPTWWQRLFRPELRGWSELHGVAVETDDYDSYEVIVDEELEIAA